MNAEWLRTIWKREEAAARIHGWDFSHIRGSCEEGRDLSWDYESVVRQYLREDTELLDYDTGGGEFLLSLKHPCSRTSATEGYPPNVRLCRETLLPLGIRFRECSDPSRVPFPDASFDLILNRHGAFDPPELYRLLRNQGVLVTEQVGGENDRDLVELVLPDTRKPYPHLNLKEQRREFEKAGFQIVQAEEAFQPITFYDTGAFVWFAKVIQWEFPGFSVDRCFENLLKIHRVIEDEGKITGTAHRYLIVAVK